MATILDVIARSLANGRATVRLPGSVPPPAGYRGAVAIDPVRCLACGVCAYVCPSGAIQGDEGPDAYAWCYDPGRCAFCARCVERCPGGALAMAPRPLAPYARPGERAESAVVPFPRCRCGAPTRPVTPALLARALGGAAEPGCALLARCERCRRRRLQRRLFTSAGPPAEEDR
jgi:NAD-dependent dihydropyrimidine dehydrogenase PreA subunit